MLTKSYALPFTLLEWDDELGFRPPSPPFDMTRVTCRVT